MTLGSIIADGRHQLVRLPEESCFPENVTTVLVRVQGQDRILSPAKTVLSWDSFFLEGDGVSEDFMNERASQTQNEREPL